MKELKILEGHWSEEGFLHGLRYRTYHKEKGISLLENLRVIDFGDRKSLNRRFVQLTWMIPLFLEWRIKDFEGNNLLSHEDFLEMKKLCSEVTNEVERILGYP